MKKNKGGRPPKDDQASLFVGFKLTAGEQAHMEQLMAQTGTTSRRRTQPPPLYTETSLLSLLADKGLGTPATRSAIVETLLKNGQIARSEDMQISGDLGASPDMRISRNSLIPTSDGLNLYEKVKTLRISDLDQAALWEQSLASIESGTMNPETFMRAFTVHVNQILKEL